MSIGEAFREHRHSLAGRIVIVGSLCNLLLAACYAWKAFDIFPGPDAEVFLAIALVSTAMPVALIGTWVNYGCRLQYRPSTLLTVLLLLISVMPLSLAVII
jgi:hypothetical protein